MGSEEMKERPWHAMAVEEAVAILESDAEKGLRNEAVEERRARSGKNRLTPRSRRTALGRFFSQFKNLFIYLLLAATVVTALLGQWLDSGVIFGVVLIIVIIGFISEPRRWPGVASGCWPRRARRPASVMS
ncbi:MAG: cation-transporting P-type ATPase [Gammaproteobacteria bacterium]|nr:cation-transporting P-type ATPase [Gammaproteobacteria bacterium]